MVLCCNVLLYRKLSKHWTNKVKLLIMIVIQLENNIVTNILMNAELL